MIPHWECCYYHEELRVFLTIYVDDVKLAGPKDNVRKTWQILQQDITLDPPTPIGHFLGCSHKLEHRELTIGLEQCELLMDPDRRLVPCDTTSAGGQHISSKGYLPTEGIPPLAPREQETFVPMLTPSDRETVASTNSQPPTHSHGGYAPRLVHGSCTTWTTLSSRAYRNTSRWPM